MNITFFSSYHPFSYKINFDKKKRRTLHHDPEPSEQTVGYERSISQSQNNTHFPGFTNSGRVESCLFLNNTFLYNSESRYRSRFLCVCLCSKGVPQPSPCGGTLNTPIYYLALHQIGIVLVLFLHVYTKYSYLHIIFLNPPKWLVPFRFVRISNLPLVHCLLKDAVRIRSQNVAKQLMHICIPI